MVPDTCFSQLFVSYIYKRIYKVVILSKEARAGGYHGQWLSIITDYVAAHHMVASLPLRIAAYT